jgi:hypothetical protein
MLRVKVTTTIEDVETGNVVESGSIGTDLVTTQRGLDVLDIATLDAVIARMQVGKPDDASRLVAGYTVAIEDIQDIRQETLNAMDRWHEGAASDE